MFFSNTIFKISIIVFVSSFLASCQTSSNSFYPENYQAISLPKLRSDLPIMTSACLNHVRGREFNSTSLKEIGFQKKKPIKNDHALYISERYSDVLLKKDGKKELLSKRSIAFSNKSIALQGCTLTFFGHPTVISEANSQISLALSSNNYKFHDFKKLKSSSVTYYKRNKEELWVIHEEVRNKNHTLAKFQVIKVPSKFARREVAEPYSQDDTSAEVIATSSGDIGKKARAENARLANQQAAAQAQRVRQQQQQFIKQTQARHAAPSQPRTTGFYKPPG